ncbi:MAG: amidase [Halodesulfurarchaeum sp.]
MGGDYRSAIDVADAVSAGERDPEAIVEEAIDRIEARNDRTNAFVTITAEYARERARDVAARLANGADLPLAGVPVGVKDLGDTIEGVVHTRGLSPLADNVAEETAVVVERLEEAGAIPVGTTNTPALGHTVRTDNDLVGPTASPFDTGRNAGGSSGGSAAALAEGLVPLATGSDVGGSLRNPAACTNVVSVKPTHGLVPKGTGLNGFLGTSPVAVRGPMARDTRSLGRMLDVMAGIDSIDPFSVPAPDEYEPAARPRDPGDLDLAYSPDLDLFPVAPAVRESLDTTLSALEDEGATVERVSLDVPDRHEVNQAYLQTVTTFFATEVEEVSRELGYDLVAEHREDLTEQFLAIVETGRNQDAMDVTSADFTRTELYHAVEDVLDRYDALVAPTLATPPLTHDEPFPTEIDGESTGGMPTDWTLAWIFNLTGHPVVNVPAALTDGLPVGMQVVGRPFAEATLLGIAATVESVSPWQYPDE